MKPTQSHFTKKSLKCQQSNFSDVFKLEIQAFQTKLELKVKLKKVSSFSLKKLDYKLLEKLERITSPLLQICFLYVTGCSRVMVFRHGKNIRACQDQVKELSVLLLLRNVRSVSARGSRTLFVVSYFTFSFKEVIFLATLSSENK